jgi:hypothetical protein
MARENSNKALEYTGNKHSSGENGLKQDGRTGHTVLSTPANDAINAILPRWRLQFTYFMGVRV